MFKKRFSIITMVWFGIAIISLFTVFVTKKVSAHQLIEVILCILLLIFDFKFNKNGVIPPTIE